GFRNPVYDAVLGQSADGARAAFEALSGDEHANLRGMLIEDTRFLRQAVLARGPDMAGAGMAGAGMAVWGQVVGSWSDVDSDGNAAGYKRSNKGLLTGFDGAVGEHWRVGAVLGYGTSEMHSRGSADLKSKNYQAGSYISGTFDRFTVQLGGSYGWHDVRSQRTVAIGSFANSLSADYDLHTLQGFGEVAWRTQLGQVQFEPFAGAAIVRLSGGALRETGGAAALQGRSDRLDTSYANAGIRMRTGVLLGGIDMRVVGSGGVRQLLHGRVPTADLSFAQGQPFRIAGAPLARTAFVGDLGLEADLSQRLTLGVSYAGQFAKRNTDNGVRAQLNWRF
ncbi:autotransporter outer membrane beta-barrel domain-containing protein, partial [Sphingomonas sp.]|uniref:autotransporter outer membrane beta-barrel domain-containing protein n=1 Tax=Sphingomonas sp. TaxID=28214 RepID=UPI003B3B6971